MTMTELVDVVAAETGVTKADTKLMLKAFVEAITNELASGGSVRIPALGQFRVGTVAAHDVKNALIGDTVHYEERRQVRFKPSAPLKCRLNDG